MTDLFQLYQGIAFPRMPDDQTAFTVGIQAAVRNLEIILSLVFSIGLLARSILMCFGISFLIVRASTQLAFQQIISFCISPMSFGTQITPFGRALLLGSIVQPSTFSFQISCTSFPSYNIRLLACNAFINFLSPMSLSRLERTKHSSWFLIALHRFRCLCYILAARFHVCTSSFGSSALLTFLNCNHRIVRLSVICRTTRRLLSIDDCWQSTGHNRVRKYFHQFRF